MQIITNRFSPSDINKPADAPANNIKQSNSEEPTENKLSAYEQGKKLQDIAILEATSNSVANNPMKLLYQTAVEEINKQLAPSLGENAKQKATDTELDVSPEATAERIVSASTAFYHAFKEQNPEMSDEESLDEFMSVIGGGIDKGFEDAKEILESLSVLEGDIEQNIDSTYDLVQEGLTNFKELILASLAEKNSENTETE